MPGFNQKDQQDRPMTGRKMGKCTNFGAGKRFCRKGRIRKF